MYSANDHLGAHLLGRNPMEHDDRDYRLEDFLDAHRRLSGQLSTSTTLQELHDTNHLDVWHDVYAFWAWFKQNVIQSPGPKPNTKPGGGWHNVDDPTLDQGQTPHCVGFTGADEGNEGSPDRHFTNADGNRLYYLCQPGDVNVPVDQQQGSDSRTLCKVLVSQGVIGSYAFASKIETMIDFINGHGVIGTGSDWLNDMFNPDQDNYLSVTGSVEGGHEYSYVDYSEKGYGNVKEPSFKMLNHWGESWGDGGYAYIRATDVEKLAFGGDGDAWAGLRKLA